MLAEKSRCPPAVFRGADLAGVTRGSFHAVVQCLAPETTGSILAKPLVIIRLTTKLFCPLLSFSSSFWVSVFTHPAALPILLMFLETAGEAGRGMDGELDSTGFGFF